MEQLNYCINAVLPMFENWLRQTVREEMESVLIADRNKKKPERMLSRDEVARMLNISLPTLWAKTKTGEIKATHIGRRVLYSESEVKRLAGM